MDPVATRNPRDMHVKQKNKSADARAEKRCKEIIMKDQSMNILTNCQSSLHSNNSCYHTKKETKMVSASDEINLLVRI